MSDAISAAAGAAFSGAVDVRDIGLRGMITLRGDLSSDAVAAAIKGAVGTGVPAVRSIERSKSGAAAWMSPDELLLMVDYAKADANTAKISKSLGTNHHLVVNVSDARAVFEVKGAGAREVLAKGAPVDLSATSFGLGDVRRSRIGQIAAAFWMTDAQTFEVVCFRSVAEFMFDWLSVAAEEGSLPEYF